jgi:hypothetical protein
MQINFKGLLGSRIVQHMLGDRKVNVSTKLPNFCRGEANPFSKQPQPRPAFRNVPRTVLYYWHFTYAGFEGCHSWEVSKRKEP